ncbi:MAG: class I SAM-dependent methyltransferase [Hyphomonadaceae bacterium]
MPHVFTRRRTLGLIAAAPFASSLAACGDSVSTGRAPPATPGTLEWALSNPARLNPERDRWRHPYETLRFWGLEPGQTVLEIYPGLGWWTSILAPYIRHNGGGLIVAEWERRRASPAQLETMQAFTARFADDERFGRIQRVELGPNSGALAPAGSVDLAIVARNVHTFMAAGFVEKAFRDIAAALRVGGVLGVEEHRASSTGVQDPLARSGYVQEAYVRTLANEAGFDFVAASDVNANAADDRDHPFGVWTLPPTLRTAPLGQPDNPNFDTAPYREIGESDRMTLKFRKRAPGALPADDLLNEEDPG